MKIAVLFDGCGLARYGLELAGHDCIGFEIDPIKVELGSYIGSGAVELQDAQSVDLKGFDAIWASPPCQPISHARTQGRSKREYDQICYLDWCRRSIYTPILWIENVIPRNGSIRGTIYNAAQFSVNCLQNRNRVIEGRFRTPHVLRPYKRSYEEAIPTIMATEYKYGKSERRRASRAFNRQITIEEAAFYQGLNEIPKEWWNFPNYILYEAIGDAVPVYMSQAFGEMYE